MNMVKLSSFALSIVLGVFMFVYGGRDDSPGAQLLGVVAIVAGIVGVINSKKKPSR